MAWTRIADCNGFARWRATPTPRLGGMILASPGCGLIVAVEGLLWAAETADEIEDGLARSFERLDWDGYRELLIAVRDAWAQVGHPSLAPAPVRSLHPTRVRKVDTRWDESLEATG